MIDPYKIAVAAVKQMGELREQGFRAGTLEAMVYGVILVIREMDNHEKAQQYLLHTCAKLAALESADSQNQANEQDKYIKQARRMLENLEQMRAAA